MRYTLEELHVSSTVIHVEFGIFDIGKSLIAEIQSRCVRYLELDLQVGLWEYRGTLTLPSPILAATSIELVLEEEAVQGLKWLLICLEDGRIATVGWGLEGSVIKISEDRVDLSAANAMTKVKPTFHKINGAVLLQLENALLEYRVQKTSVKNIKLYSPDQLIRQSKSEVDWADALLRMFSASNDQYVSVGENREGKQFLRVQSISGLGDINLFLDEQFLDPVAIHALNTGSILLFTHSQVFLFQNLFDSESEVSKRTRSSARRRSMTEDNPEVMLISKCSHIEARFNGGCIGDYRNHCVVSNICLTVQGGSVYALDLNALEAGQPEAKFLGDLVDSVIFNLYHVSDMFFYAVTSNGNLLLYIDYASDHPQLVTMQTISALGSITGMSFDSGNDDLAYDKLILLSNSGSSSKGGGAGTVYSVQVAPPLTPISTVIQLDESKIIENVQFSKECITLDVNDGHQSAALILCDLNSDGPQIMEGLKGQIATFEMKGTMVKVCKDKIYFGANVKGPFKEISLACFVSNEWFAICEDRHSLLIFDYSGELIHEVYRENDITLITALNDGRFPSQKNIALSELGATNDSNLTLIHAPSGKVLGSTSIEPGVVRSFCWVRLDLILVGMTDGTLKEIEITPEFELIEVDCTFSIGRRPCEIIECGSNCIAAISDSCIVFNVHPSLKTGGRLNSSLEFSHRIVFPTDDYGRMPVAAFCLEYEWWFLIYSNSVAKFRQATEGTAVHLAPIQPTRKNYLVSSAAAWRNGGLSVTYSRIDRDENGFKSKLAFYLSGRLETEYDIPARITCEQKITLDNGREILVLGTDVSLSEDQKWETAFVLFLEIKHKEAHGPQFKILGRIDVDNAVHAIAKQRGTKEADRYIALGIGPSLEIWEVISDRERPGVRGWKTLSNDLHVLTGLAFRGHGRTKVTNFFARYAITSISWCKPYLVFIDMSSNLTTLAVNVIESCEPDARKDRILPRIIGYSDRFRRLLEKNISFLEVYVLGEKVILTDTTGEVFISFIDSLKNATSLSLEGKPGLVIDITKEFSFKQRVTAIAAPNVNEKSPYTECVVYLGTISGSLYKVKI